MSAIINKLVRAANAHDLDAMAALLHPDYRSLQPAHPARAFVGRSQFRANWEAMFAGIPDFRAELGRVVQDRDTAWCEWAWFGMRTDKRSFEVRGVVLCEIRDGLIATGTLFMEEVESEAVGIEQAVQKLSGRRPD